MTQTMRKRLRRERRKVAEARAQRMAEARREALVARLAKITVAEFRAGRTHSLFAYEATFRTAIRADLCLQGWSWAIADDAACDLVAAALARCGAKRPSWNEGQPEHVVEGGVLLHRTRCASCHGLLPEGRRKFCSHYCKTWEHRRIARVMAGREDIAGTACRSAI